MSMPADAITAILALSPSHLWVMNETSGTTFADSVVSGGAALTIGTNVTPNWGTVSAAPGGFGGPKTIGPRFSGSGSYASTPGKTLGGRAQWSMFAWLIPEVLTGDQVIYAEGGAATTDYLVVRFSSGSMLVTYRDSGNSIVTITSGASASSMSAGLLGVTTDGTGAVRFYRSGYPAYATVSAGFPTGPSTWADTVNTYVGYDPQAIASPFQGMIAWVFTVPSCLTDAQVFALSQAVSPNEPGTYTWSKSASGAVFPNSEMWNSKLPASATLDPNGFSKVQEWASVNAGGTRTALGGGGTTMVDANRAGGTMVPLKDSFYTSPDQVAFLGQCNAPMTTTVSAPQPIGGGNDSLGAGVELDRGRVWDIYKGTQVGPTNHSNQHPQWNPYISSTTISTGLGTLASGWYLYYITVVTTSGEEGGFYGYGSSASVDLTSEGSINLFSYVDTQNWADPPVSYRIYRRGPYSTSGGGTYADFGLLTTIAVSSWVNYTAGINEFTDNGSLTPDTTKKPNLTVSAPFTLTVSGTNSAGQEVLTVRSNPNSFNHATYGIPTWDTDIPIGPITLGTGGTLETVFIHSVLSDTQVQLVSNLAFTHNDGESFGPITNVYGAVGYALGPEITTKGGGGSWDWYNNATFNPSFSPSGGTNNGESASSRPCLAGTITGEEALNALIPHPMVMAMYASINSINRHWWPAPRNDGSTVSTALNIWGEGMRMRLPTGFDETTLTYTTKTAVAAAFQKAFVVCMRDYGTFVCDSSPGGLFYIEDTFAEVGRNDAGWIYSGLSSGTGGVPSILDFFFVPGPTITGNITIGSTTVTSVSTFTGVTANAYIIGAAGVGVPYLTQISSTNSGAGTLVLTKPATATATGVSLYIGPMYQLQLLSAFRYAAKADAFASFTATATAGSTTLTSVSSFTNLYPGLVLSSGGAGIFQHATTVVSVNSGAGTLVMSQPAALSGTAAAITGGRRTNKTSVGTLNTPGFQQLVPY